MDEQFGNKLFRDGQQYGDRYVEHLLEQYKLYIVSTEKISDRRQAANSFFLGLNTAFLGLLGWLLTKPEVGGELMFSVAAFAGIVICYLWYRQMRSYRDINSAKFKVVHAIEQRLPLSMYDVEWDLVQRGENRDAYWPFSHIEMIVPWVFILIYALILAITATKQFSGL